MARKTIRAMSVGVGVAVLLVLGMIVAPTMARADAYGIQHWGGFHANIKGQSVSIPSGQLAHVIKSHGRNMTHDGASWLSVGNLCDWSIKFTYGYNAMQISGAVHYGCSHQGTFALNLVPPLVTRFYAPRGSACAELWVKEWRARVARQCHFVS